MSVLNARQIILTAHSGFRQLLTPNQMGRTRLILLGQTMLALADIVGLGSMVPVLMLALDHSFLEKSSKLRFIFHHLGFTAEANFLKTLIGIILLFFLVKGILAYLLQQYIRKTASDLAFSLSRRAYNRVFEERSYDRLNHDGPGFNEVVFFSPFYFVSGTYIPYLTLMSELAIVVLLTAFFTWYNPFIFILIVGLIGGGFFLVNRFARKRITELGEAGAGHRDKALREINYGSGGFTDIITHGAEDHFREKMLHHFRGFSESGIRAINLQTLPFRVNEMIALVGITLLVVYAYFYSSDNIGQVRALAALFAIAIFRMLPAANRVLQSLMHLKLSAYTIDQLRPVVSEPALKKERIGHFQQEIAMKNIHFAFSDKPDIIRALDLSIRKGESVGIRGVSGAGKTTLVKLLMGFYLPKSGEIYVDGRVIDEGKSTLELFAYLGQDPYIINGTIADNVVFGSEDKEKSKILKALEMAAFSWPEAGENWLEAEVGDHGSRLSEGQKQRLAMARAIYHDSEILILDEPSSALDDATEKILLSHLQELKNSGKTLIIIAHREKVFDICDTVYTLENKHLTPYKK
ncbi:MAG: ATP-binding cassette domain-containing protein [Sphingomonadales bacterium]